MTQPSYLSALLEQQIAANKRKHGFAGNAALAVQRSCEALLSKHCEAIAQRHPHEEIVEFWRGIADDVSSRLSEAIRTKPAEVTQFRSALELLSPLPDPHWPRGARVRRV
jgi:hypothetical protein